ncbi:MAG: SRPBCC family protein [Anaerolineae bacterium]
MVFTTQITIARPRQRVLELIRNPDNLPKWQPGLLSVELISGEKDQVGAKSRVIYEMRGIRLPVTETIIKHAPPDVFVSAYESRGVKNVSENRFFEDGPDATRWVLINDFRFTGFMSVMGLFFQDTVPKQTLESMKRFKAFAESN